MLCPRHGQEVSGTVVGSTGPSTDEMPREWLGSDGSVLVLPLTRQWGWVSPLHLSESQFVHLEVGERTIAALSAGPHLVEIQGDLACVRKDLAPCEVSESALLSHSIYPDSHAGS